MAVLHTLSDEALIGLLKSGDHAAFTEIYNRYWNKLYVTAYHRLADELEAEEAVQNIFVDLWHRKETLELKHTVTTYLSSAVKYQVFTRLAQMKREKQRSELMMQTIASGKETTAEWLSERELREQIEKCVKTLPEKCQVVFRLSREQYLSNKEISEQLNISEKTVEGHMTKALSTLRGAVNVSLPILLAVLENKLH